MTKKIAGAVQSVSVIEDTAGTSRSSGVVTIANGQSLSGASDSLSGTDVVALITDSAFDTNTMTFQASINGTDFFDVMDVDSGSEYAISGVAASKWIPVKPMNFYGALYIKVRSGTSSTPATQSGATTITLAKRKI